MRFSLALTSVVVIAIQCVSGSSQCPKSTKSNPNKGEVYDAAWDFAKKFYNNKNLDSAMNKYVAADYIQHNPDIGDGRQAAINGLRSLWADPKTSFVIHNLFFGENGFLVQVEARFSGGPKMLVYDVFGLQGTCIIEHWDAMSTMKQQTVSKHPYF